MATQHHAQHEGLQAHSVGGSYPWSIVGIGDRWQAQNLIDSNERGPVRLHYGQAQNDIPQPFLGRLVSEEWAASRLRKRNGIVRELDKNLAALYAVEDNGSLPELADYATT
jgi:hypothetical protein